MAETRSVSAKSRPSRRRWFRFSLRALLLVMTVAAVWLGFAMQRIRERHQAIEAILSRGGTIVFDGATKISGGRGSPTGSTDAAPGRPAWLRRLLGDHGKYVNCRAVSISFGGRATSRDTAIAVSLLAALAEAKRLSFFVPMDEATLAQLPELPYLTMLQLGDDVFASDEGLQCLERLPRVTDLLVRRGALKGEGYRRIATRQDLETIALSNCTLTAEGLEQLARLPKLFNLGLEGSTVGDDAVPALSQMRGLRFLVIRGSNVSEQGVAQLRAALPKCTIHTNGGTLPPLRR